MKLSKGKKLILIGVILVIIDQVTKILVKTNMELNSEIYVFDWFRIHFIENEGMAFGLSFGKFWGKIILTTFRLGLFGFLVWWIHKLLKRKEVPMGVLVGLTLITAGALGNIIDCLFYGLIFSGSEFGGPVAEFGGSYAPFMLGKVVDMLYFPLIDTTWPDWMPFFGGKAFKFFEPVFNFADSCVTVGAFYLILFQYKFFLKDDKKTETELQKK